MFQYVMPAVFAVGAMASSVSAKDTKKSVDTTVEHCYKAFEGKATGDEQRAAIVSTIDGYFKKNDKDASTVFALENDKMYVIQVKDPLSIYEFDLGRMLGDISQRSNKKDEKVCISVTSDLSQYLKKVDLKDVSRFEDFDMTPTNYFMSQEYAGYVNDLYGIKKVNATLDRDSKKLGKRVDDLNNNIDASLDSIDADLKMLRDGLVPIVPPMDPDEGFMDDLYDEK